MEYRQLGPSGLTVSEVGVGCNAFGSRIDEERTRSVVTAALDAGITFFDTSDTYGTGASEQLLGKALGDIATMWLSRPSSGWTCTAPTAPTGEFAGRAATSARRFTQSLSRLGTDWVDLYQMHTPDPLTPIEETLEALHELVLEGKVRYVGSSNFSGWQVVDAHWVAQANGACPLRQRPEQVLAVRQVGRR